MIQKGIMIASAGLVVVFLIAILGRAHSSIVLITHLNESIPFADIEASFAPRISGAGIMGVLYVAKPLNACLDLGNPAPKDRQFSPILLVERGGCTFEEKVRIAQQAGYAAVIVYNDDDGEELVTMSGDSVGIYINAVFVSKETANVLLQYVNDADTRCYILPAFDNTAWSVMAVSFLSLLAVSAVLLTFFFVRRYRIRSSRFLLSREPRGLSIREVKAIPSIIFKSVEGSGTTDACAICLEDYEVGEKLRILPCHHDFHALCVDKWLTTRRAFCPICKRDMHSKSSVGPPSEQTPLLSSVSRSPILTETPSIPIQTPAPLDTQTYAANSLYSTAYSLASSPNRRQAALCILAQDTDNQNNISRTSNTEGMFLSSSRTLSHHWSTGNCNVTLPNKNYCSVPIYRSSSDSSDSFNSSSQGSDLC
uniref:RING-type E3 ubiquitin transferase n=1 Tax=Araucaria cunninghamii TaxID=56994 RepID=A0A0D6R5Q1_ARACU